MRRGKRLMLSNTECNLNNEDDSDIQGVADAMFGEELAAFLGDEFPYNNDNYNENPLVFTNDSVDPLDYLNMHGDNTMMNANNNNTDDDNIVTPHQQTQCDSVNNGRMMGGSSAQPSSERPKRRRQASQLQDHIMAERKRRELLTRQFIALSAIVPGLKKIKSVLGETIKHLQELKEKVKALEEVVANKQTMESVVLVKRSQLVVVDNNTDHHNNSSSFDDISSIHPSNHANEHSLPHIEVKVSDKKLLFKINCENQKGILPNLFSEMEKYGLTILTTSIIPFGALALDITILAQMGMGVEENVMDMIRGLYSVFQP